MREQLVAANTAYEQGNIESALQITKKHLRFNNSDARGWELIGLIQYSRGRFRVSVSALERAALFAPWRPAARVCLAHGYAKVGRVLLSRDLLSDMIDDESITVPLLLQVAVGLDAVNEPCLAMNACRAAIEREPEFAQPYYDMGYYAAICGYPAHMSESLARKAISLDPDNARYRVGLSSLLVKQDCYREAYGFVSCLSLNQLAEIRCPCCLRRLIGLYEDFGDQERAEFTQQQLMEVESG